MARSPLFSFLRRSLRLALQAKRSGAPPAAEWLSARREADFNRRGFLCRAGAVALTAAAGPVLTGCASTGRRGGVGPSVAIVGGGLAGLTAAYHLKGRGIGATVYEAGARVGGRVYSARDILSPGLTTELGGEFIDTGHGELLLMARMFRLPLLDMRADDPRLVEEAFYFEGRHHSAEEMVDAFRPMALRIAADRAALPEDVDFAHPGSAEKLDRTSLAEYLDQIGASGVARKVIETAYVTEYGLDSDEQSALNLVYLIDTDLSDGALSLYGESDERYKIAGGNGRIVEELGERLSGQVEPGHRLEALRAEGHGYVLTFARAGGGTRDVRADMVVLAVPFTMLRQVELPVELPAAQRRAIAELGYGTNAKVLVAMGKRVWRDQGYVGSVYSDEAFQLAWDNSRLQSGSAGGLTLYSGGRAGVAVGEGTAEAQAERLLPGAERVFPGVAGAAGKARRFHWPSHPLSLGSYSCYKPGQWTTIRGAEGLPGGNLLFAGEHCSRDHQGFMNGAVETGRLAAMQIVAIVAKR